MNPEDEPSRLLLAVQMQSGEIVEVPAVRAPLGPHGHRHAEASHLVGAVPIYPSWEDFLVRTTEAERRAWCSMKAKRSNRERLMSGPVDVRITGAQVWPVLEAARGRCAHCGSLAVERRPSKGNGAPAPWHPVGRRIGSLGHREERVRGGSNDPSNLEWTCLWCNTWPGERRAGARDHGGLPDR